MLEELEAGSDALSCPPSSFVTADIVSLIQTPLVVRGWS